MQVVVDIPEGAYNLLKTSGVDWLGAEHILNAVANGTALPKGHGRLIDVNEITAFRELECNGHDIDSLNEFKTIVEADECTCKESKVMTFEDKAEIIISQLREDRDKLQNIINQIKTEIEDTGAYEQEVHGKTEFLRGINYCLSILDKYKEEKDENKEIDR